MSSAASLLLDAVPDWFRPSEVSGGRLTGMAHVRGTPWEADGIELAIIGRQSVSVGELVPGTQLPARCPERHIQGDLTFCVGLDPKPIDVPEAAIRWWEQLRQYLRCQGVADRTKVWPPAHSLDHGDAGRFHERALALASAAGVEEEYAAARLGEPSWITDPNLRIVDRRGGFINGRAVCPRGCRRRASRNAPVVRRNCERRQMLSDLVYSEQQRIKALAKYWQHVLNDGTRCCRTMLACPIRDKEKAATATWL